MRPSGELLTSRALSSWMRETAGPGGTPAWPGGLTTSSPGDACHFISPDVAVTKITFQLFASARPSARPPSAPLYPSMTEELSSSTGICQRPGSRSLLELIRSHPSSGYKIVEIFQDMITRQGNYLNIVSIQVSGRPILTPPPNVKNVTFLGYERSQELQVLSLCLWVCKPVCLSVCHSAYALQLFERVLKSS